MHALRGVNLDFPKGDFVAIMGSSGSGKSTLLNLLGALDRPTGGQYILGGYDVSKMSDNDLSDIRNRLIGFIFQSYNLIPQYTVLENIEVPLHYRASRRPIDGEDRDRCEHLAKLVGLDGRFDHKPFQLSGGQQQTCGHCPGTRQQSLKSFLPTNQQETSTQKPKKRSCQILLDLNAEGRTIIMVTHEDNVAKLAKRQIHMKDGQVAGEGLFRG